LRTDLATARCELTPASPSDAPQLHGLWTGAGVRRYLWDGETIPRQRTDEAIAASEALFEKHGFGLWLLRERNDRALVGFAGLWPFRQAQEFELLYGIDEAVWGRGYAVEAARAVVEHCFGTLGMAVIKASTDVANAASLRVLEKLGFTQTRRGTIDGLDTVFFEKQR
jgi:[ribosomal protein S5]-alanine N-acetyltransferase